PSSPHLLPIFLLVALLVSAAEARQQGSHYDRYRQWRQFGGSPENIHYSTLREINRDNVKKLQVAWTYDSGDAFPGSEMQCNPIVIDRTLYATTPKLRVIALDAATGQLHWSFDPNQGNTHLGKMRNRGLTFWREGTEERIYFAYQNWLYALDAKTGRPAPEFGEAGRVDLRKDLGRDPATLTVGLTTRGVEYRDLLIVGSIVSETLPAAPGHIRAYDVRTGKLRWIFHTIPQPGELGYETWPPNAWEYIGGANNWCGPALDEKR